MPHAPLGRPEQQAFNMPRRTMQTAAIRMLFSPRSSGLAGSGLYSTVTLFARFRGLSTSQPRATAM